LHIKYCDSVCQHLDWKEGHKYECRGLRKWRAEEQLYLHDEKQHDSFDAARLILRVVAKLKKVYFWASYVILTPVHATKCN